MIATRTSGVGRPAEARRSRAIEPSGRKCSSGAIVEIIIGASVWPKSWPMTGPIRVSASSRRATDIGAAPYQKHCNDDRSVASSRSWASTMYTSVGGRNVCVMRCRSASARKAPTSGVRMTTTSPPRASTGKQSTPAACVSGASAR